MTEKPQTTIATRMSGIREDWLRLTQEEVLEPDLAIDAFLSRGYSSATRRPCGLPEGPRAGYNVAILRDRHSG
jgi:hypothetical protein